MQRTSKFANIFSSKQFDRFLIGLLVVIYVYVTVHYILLNLWPETLWMCDFCPLGLAIGMYKGWPRLVWISTMILLVGSITWLTNIALDGFDYCGFDAFLIHVVALLIALFAIKRRPSNRASWSQALYAMLFIQLATRLLTPESYNVNFSYRPYKTFPVQFDNYLYYSLLMTLLYAITLFFAEKAMKQFTKNRIVKII